MQGFRSRTVLKLYVASDITHWLMEYHLNVWALHLSYTTFVFFVINIKSVNEGISYPAILIVLAPFSLAPTLLLL